VISIDVSRLRRRIKPETIGDEAIFSKESDALGEFAKVQLVLDVRSAPMLGWLKRLVVCSSFDRRRQGFFTKTAGARMRVSAEKIRRSKVSGHFPVQAAFLDRAAASFAGQAVRCRTATGSLVVVPTLSCHKRC
jgi:hypothetical protein